MYWQLGETDCVAQERRHTGRPGKEEGGGGELLIKGKKGGGGGIVATIIEPCTVTRSIPSTKAYFPNPNPLLTEYTLLLTEHYPTSTCNAYTPTNLYLDALAKSATAVPWQVSRATT